MSIRQVAVVLILFAACDGTARTTTTAEIGPTTSTTSAASPSTTVTNGWIAYSTKDHLANASGAEVEVGDLYVVKPGSEPRVLVEDGKSNVCPAFSPDGTLLAYRTDNELLVFEMDEAGALGRQVVRQPLIPNSSTDPCPAWSPDSARLAVVTSDGLMLLEVGGGLSWVDVDDFTFGVDWPHRLGWSPVGGTIATTTERGVLFVDLDGGGSRLLVAGLTANLAWSPDGSRIAFQQSMPVDPGDPLGGPSVCCEALHVITLDGQADEVVLEGGWDPVWSPTGDRIAYSNTLSSDRVADCSVFVVAPDGSEGHTAARGCYYSLGPWSPDGLQILHMLDVGSAWQLGASATSDPSDTAIIIPRVSTPSLRNWPGLEDVSWQPVYPNSSTN